MQAAPPYPASLTAHLGALWVQLTQLAARVPSLGIDATQSRREALTVLGRSLRDESSFIAHGDHLALIGAALLLMFCIALWLVRVPELGAAAR